MTSMFLAHGSPIHAFSENRFSQIWKELGKLLPTPKEILILSAHWLTDGTKICGDPKPKTIHDFYGFPDHFYEFHYPANGAEKIIKALTNSPLKIEESSYGLDHGAWALLKFLYPLADIPCSQMSLDANLSLEEHFELAKSLKEFIPQDTLILGSGNIVHNLKRMNKDESGQSCWAVNFEKEIKTAIENCDLDSLFSLPYDHSKGGPTALPTLEHYIPLIYVLGLAQNGKKSFPIEGVIHDSISMFSLITKES